MNGGWSLPVALATSLLPALAIVVELAGLDVGGRAGQPVAAVALAPPAPPQAPYPPNAVETILARPLFAPDRRTKSDETADYKGSGLPRLTGIILTRDHRMAVFQAAGEKPKTVPEGGTIGTWTVDKIDHQRVMVRNSGGTMTLVPTKNTAPTAGVSAGGPSKGAPYANSAHRPQAMPAGVPPAGAVMRP